MATAVDPCSIPAVAPPAGMVSNFVDPPSLAPVIQAVLSILVAWATVFCVVRIYNNRRELSWGDFTTVLATAMAIAYDGVLFSGRRTFRHNWDIPVCWYDGAWVQNIFICSFLYHVGSFFAKLSIFLLFFQVFKVQAKMRYAIWVGMIFNFMIYFTGLVIAIYYDTPRSGETWEGVLLSGSLLIPIHWVQLESGLITLLDLYIFILPLPATFKLKMPMRQRISILAIFSLAALGIGASIASLAERIPIEHKLDQTWIAAILSLCSAVELHVAIIVSCGPAFARAARNLPDFPSLSSVKSLISSSHSRTETGNESKHAPSSMSSRFAKSNREGSSMMTDDAPMMPNHSHNWRNDSEGTLYQNVDATPKDSILRTQTINQESVAVSPATTQAHQNYFLPNQRQ